MSGTSVPFLFTGSKMVSTNKLHDCEECSATFTIKFDLDPDFFTIKYCPFCGGELSEDDLYMSGNNDK